MDNGGSVGRKLWSRIKNASVSDWLDVGKNFIYIVANPSDYRLRSLEAKDFKAVRDGAVYEVASSHIIARGKIKQVIVDAPVTSPLTGKNQAQRELQDIIPAFNIPVRLYETAALLDLRKIYYDDSDRKSFIHGVLYQTTQGRPYVVVFYDQKKDIATFNSRAEFLKWCEITFSADECIELSKRPMCFSRLQS